MAKAIINGKKYDTETAMFIGNESYSNSSDYHYYDEDLYRKKTGEFFLVGEGGPLSKYRIQTAQNSWSGTVDMFTPLSEEEARRWIERNCSAETYIELFGEPEE